MEINWRKAKRDMMSREELSKENFRKGPIGHIDHFTGQRVFLVKLLLLVEFVIN